MSEWVQKLVREPLVHFLGMALLIFIVFAAVRPGIEDSSGVIEVSEARIEQLAGIFAKTWQRPPTAPELKGLIDDYVKEEISYREAKALGLDQDDTVIRRRMRQKLEFLTSSDASPAPTDAEIQAYLDANAERYAVEPRISFSQVFFDPQRRSLTINEDVAGALEQLRTGASLGTTDLGDATMLPQSVDLAYKRIIERDFGSQFADALLTTKKDQWAGPITSSFGLHLVLVSEHQPGQRATLDQARAAVVRDLAEDRRKEREAKRFAELLKKYEIIIAHPSAAAPQQTEER